MNNFLETLLGDAGKGVPDVRKDLPQKRYEVPRLTQVMGKKAEFTLQGLPYGRVQELQALDRDVDIHILLAGCTEPNLRSEDLMRRFDAPTPADAVKALLLPGEIADLAREVEKLCGYRRLTIEEVKND